MQALNNFFTCCFKSNVDTEFTKNTQPSLSSKESASYSYRKVRTHPPSQNITIAGEASAPHSESRTLPDRKPSIHTFTLNGNANFSTLYKEFLNNPGDFRLQKESIQQQPMSTSDSRFDELKNCQVGSCEFDAITDHLKNNQVAVVPAKSDSINVVMIESYNQ